MNNTGANTSTVVNVEASSAGHTSRTPASAASKRDIPLRLRRSMFSSTTMVLSRVMPMAKATPAMEMTLIVRPASCRPISAAIVHKGRPTTAIKVPDQDRKNRYSTSEASTAPMIRFCQTLASESST